MRALKKILLFALIFVILICGIFIYIKATPPLATRTVFNSEDNKTVVVALGNKGFGELKVTGVKVNNNADPNVAKMQVSNALEGFKGTIDEKSEARENIEFKNIQDVSIPKGTVPENVLQKQGERKATVDDTIYGLTVNHHEEIHNIHIKYRYFGILFNETIILD